MNSIYFRQELFSYIPHKQQARLNKLIPVENEWAKVPFVERLGFSLTGRCASEQN
jgi:hypothetical protein